MNLKEINQVIAELENGDSSLSSIRNLASLYIVRERLKKPTISVVEVELNDILPQYQQYCNIKRKYQLKELTEDAIYPSLKSVCKETKEFIQSLYSNTDTPKERELIKELITDLSGAF